MAFEQIVGYNRQEAAYLFQESLKNDEKNPFFHWAIAYCHGADYNMYGAAYKSLRTTPEWPSLEVAKKHSEDAVKYANTNDEWYPIYSALALRYKTKSIESYVEALDQTVTNSMNCDIIAIHAEAHMLLEPWSLWDRKTMKRSANAKIVQEILDKGLKICPKHQWLCHLKIHYCEMGPSSQFDMNVLAPLETSLHGHLRHMPTHIYIQKGEYIKSMKLNMEAVELDASARNASISPLHLYSFYECHNIHFVVFAACMSGNRTIALKYADILTQFVLLRLQESNPIADAMCEAF